MQESDSAKRTRAHTQPRLAVLVLLICHTMGGKAGWQSRTDSGPFVPEYYYSATFQSTSFFMLLCPLGLGSQFLSASQHPCVCKSFCLVGTGWVSGTPSTQTCLATVHRSPG
eukprot:2549080-Rhodomonas_salina.1